MTTPFYGDIALYDIHTYYDPQLAEETAFAKALYAKAQEEFQDLVAKGDLRIQKFWDQPIGPHTLAMFEIDFKTQEAFSRAVPFYQVHHGSLSVLIHPHTPKGDLVDHTVHALWLGTPVPLKLETLTDVQSGFI